MLHLDNTVEPRYNEHRYNEILVITKEFCSPCRILHVSMYFPSRYNEPRYNENPVIAKKKWPKMWKIDLVITKSMLLIWKQPYE